MEDLPINVQINDSIIRNDMKEDRSTRVQLSEQIIYNTSLLVCYGSIQLKPVVLHTQAQMSITYVV